ncbi:glycosyltransferase family protein [Pseudoflavonifractor phocaeensis]|uniref:glycosyltransferase family protein n=1 Tax=Pseudoflavonifractor phocaeensis TaxID=1870988 RepID=UPI001FB038E3|nr:hypothetical protein [Pseudoflavonifractor phocaeensis]
MRQIICISDAPWSAVPGRTQQLMSRLENAQVLFFEPSDGPWLGKRIGRKVRPGLVVYTLPPVLDEEARHTFLFRQEQRKLARFIESAMQRHRFREAVLWCATPRAVHLLDYLPCRGVVYDCAQDWSHLPIQWESEMALAADVVFSASDGLTHHLSPCTENAALLPNGANFPLFSRKGRTVPPALRDLRGPVLGYEGTLWPDLDLSPLLYTARALPYCTVVLVGRVLRNPQLHRLERLPNVLLTGPQTPIDLPAYVERFDVCLNLLREDEVYDVLPQRIFEYFSTGKPIVSMLRPGQVEPYPDVIYAAHTPAEFARLCADALGEAGSWARERRRAYGARSSWSARAKQVESILESIGLFSTGMV